ncbi:MAG: AMP-binding protein, partial [Anaerolineae bacterium]|nr:AMP-binding protein [Anaerolineae bacterium]
LVLMSPFDWVRHPAMLLKAIHEYKATLCWLPNFAYNHLARTVRQRDSEGLDLTSIQAFINCSEPVRNDSHALFAERFAANGITMNQISVSYAMAENTFAVTQTPVGEAPNVDSVNRLILQQELKAILSANEAEAEKIVSCGKPINGVSVKVVNESGQLLSERQVGEILVKSDCMLTSYYKRDDLQPFDSEGWYRTGDKGYVADGEVYIVGRSKDLIINAGKNVYPQDIEAIVNSVTGVHPGRAVAFGVPDEREGTELIAVVAEVDSSEPAVRKQIMQAIRQQVARQSDITLNFVTLVDKGWLIKTSSGKIARGKNREKWLSERQSE